MRRGNGFQLDDDPRYRAAEIKEVKRRTELWRSLAQHTERDGLLAATPLILYLLGLVVSCFWSPVLFRGSAYSWVDLGMLIVLAVGTLWGVRRRVPLWSYSWIVFWIVSIGKLALHIVLRQGAVSPSVFATLPATGLAAFTAFLIVVSLLGRRGVRFGMFAILLALLYQQLPFFDFRGNPYVAEGTANVLTTVFVVLAVAEAAIAVVMVLRFLRTSGDTQRRCLYPLAGIVFIDAAFTGWTVSVCTPANPLVAAISAVATSWVIAGISLLVVWGLSHALTRPADGGAVGRAGQG